MCQRSLACVGARGKFEVRKVITIYFNVIGFKNDRISMSLDIAKEYHSDNHTWMHFKCKVILLIMATCGCELEVDKPLPDIPTRNSAFYLNFPTRKVGIPRFRQMSGRSVKIA